MNFKKNILLLMIVATGQLLSYSVTDLLKKGKGPVVGGPLKRLNLSGKGLTTLRGLDAIKNIDRARVINLANNRLTSIPTGALAVAENVTVLNVAGNKLTADGLQGIAGLKNLRALVLNSNNVSDIPSEVLDSLPKFTFVALYDNPISDEKIAALRKRGLYVSTLPITRANLKMAGVAAATLMTLILASVATYKVYQGRGGQREGIRPGEGGPLGPLLEQGRVGEVELRAGPPAPVSERTPEVRETESPAGPSASTPERTPLIRFNEEVMKYDPEQHTFVEVQKEGLTAGEIIQQITANINELQDMPLPLDEKIPVFEHYIEQWGQLLKSQPENKDAKQEYNYYRTLLDRTKGQLRFTKDEAGAKKGRIIQQISANIHALMQRSDVPLEEKISVFEKYAQQWGELIKDHPEGSYAKQNYNNYIERARGELAAQGGVSAAVSPEAREQMFTERTSKQAAMRGLSRKASQFKSLSSGLERALKVKGELDQKIDLLKSALAQKSEQDIRRLSAGVEQLADNIAGHLTSEGNRTVEPLILSIQDRLKNLQSPEDLADLKKEIDARFEEKKDDFEAEVQVAFDALAAYPESREYTEAKGKMQSLGLLSEMR